MNWKHLLWIIPITLFIGFLLGLADCNWGLRQIAEDYPIVGCVISVEQQMNPNTNMLGEFISPDVQRAYSVRRCVEMTVDMNASLDIS